MVKEELKDLPLIELFHKMAETIEKLKPFFMPFIKLASYLEAIQENMQDIIRKKLEEVKQ